MHEVSVRAPGKVNLDLVVGRRRPDGYHELATVLCAVSLFDDVRARTSADFSVTTTFDGVLGDVPSDERNIALRAAQLLAAHTGCRAGAALHITKRVPIAAGMGGGSADAAATLVACNALWGTALSPESLQALGARLGADVPFALLGGVAVGTGRGDRVRSVPASDQLAWVLAIDDAGLATADVFAALDAQRDHAGGERAFDAGEPVVSPQVLAALAAGDTRLLGAALRNDLQDATLSMRPDRVGVLSAGMHAGALGATVSGSGPTVAFLARDPSAASQIASRLRASGLQAVCVTGPQSGARRMS